MSDRRTEGIAWRKASPRHVTLYLKSKASTSWYRLRYPRFWALGKQAGGMLAAPVYKRMYEEIQQVPDLDVIEVGGASGAGSIALYQGMREAGKKARLIIVEKCEGGSRIEHGGYDDNLVRLQTHLARFGATQNVEIFPHAMTTDNVSDVVSLITSPELGAFVHDADGAIDRDFAAFWPRTVAGGLIVIDDYEAKHRYVPVSARYPDGGSKGVLTYRLLNQFIEWGLFEPMVLIGLTMFGHKPTGADFSRFDQERCDAIRAELDREYAAQFPAS